MKYANIIMSITNKEVDKIFSYKIPVVFKDKIHIGMRVSVPFGAGNKRTQGFVIGFSNEIDFDESKVKEIHSLLDDKPIFSEKMIALAMWMKNKYYTTLASCLKCIMPSGIDMKTDYLITVLNNMSVSQKADKIITYILENNNSVTLSELEQEFGSISSSINSMEKKGVINKTQLSKVNDYTLRIKYAYLNDELDDIQNITDDIIKKNGPQGKVLSLIRESNGLPVSDIKNFLKISDSPIQTLLKNGLIVIEKVEVRRNISFLNNPEYERPKNLTKEQINALDFINLKLPLKNKKPILLHGVTGSGKTEIYIKIIEEVLKLKKKAIVLVPEISLTPQTVSRFVSCFKDNVSVTHSKLSLGERFDQWKKARDNEISIMIGPRSAIFTPFDDLGVIIIDEEHENTYTSETTPKYNTKDVAIKLSELTGCLVILGSATPSIDSYYNTQNGNYDLIEIKDRVNKSLPEINIVDMRNELANGNRSIFSNDLKEALIKNVENNEQSILFLNRRGHSTFVSCRSCGSVLKCENCNVNYTYHQNSRYLICHYCGSKRKNPENCPVCGSKFIKFFGVGTQKVEEEIKNLFPDEMILRMDMDTVSRKHSHEKILNSFKNGESKILIGTQMIAKGLDFPNVTLVGIIAADVSLNNGDFRCAENTYHLLTQVSGRAGRADKKGTVFIQTYNPEHYSIVFTKDNDYKSFYKHEISLRRQMIYPPFSNIFTIVFISEREKEVIEHLYKLLDIMNYFNKKNQFEILGPAPNTISKIKNKYRWRLIIKCVDEEKLKNFVFYCLDKLSQTEKLTNITMNLTLNPVVVL